MSPTGSRKGVQANSFFYFKSKRISPTFINFVLNLVTFFRTTLLRYLVVIIRDKKGVPRWVIGHK